MTPPPPQQSTFSAPCRDFVGDEPLIAVMRGDFIGSLHRGTFAVTDDDGRIQLYMGDVEQPIFLRSGAKPFQIMPAILAGGIDRFGITEEEIAVLCASHNAEPRHTEKVLGVLAKLDLDESALHCGVHPPIHQATARRRWREGLEPTPVCNNCSGAHTGMLMACRVNNWPLDDYGSPEHPLQQLTRQILAAFVGIAADAIQLATDNCHVPTFRVPVLGAAQAFARLTTGRRVGNDLGTAAARVVAAMTTYPEMIGGEHRFDSDLMRVAHGDLLAKGGAEGFQGIGIRTTGLGLALKISNGNDSAVPPAAVQILRLLGALDAEQVSRLESYREPIVTDLENEVVGHLSPLFGSTASA